MASDFREIEKRLWKTADQLRANSGLKPSEYSRPALGLLSFAMPKAGLRRWRRSSDPKPAPA